jgi:hypothetical protein
MLAPDYIRPQRDGANENYTTNTQQADALAHKRYISFFQVRHPSCVSMVQLYLTVLKVVLDYILDILYLYNGTLPYQPRDATNTFASNTLLLVKPTVFIL